jgi:hypothetical protein
MQGEPNSLARGDMVEIWRNAQGRRNEDLRTWLRRRSNPDRSIRNPGFGGSAKPPHDAPDFPGETQFPK